MYLPGFSTAKLLFFPFVKILWGGTLRLCKHTILHPTFNLLIYATIDLWFPISFRGLYCIIYFNDQFAADLASGSPSCVGFVAFNRFPSFFERPLVTHIRCSRLILYLLCPTLESNISSKNPDFLSEEIIIVVKYIFYVRICVYETYLISPPRSHYPITAAILALLIARKLQCPALGLSSFIGMYA